VRFCSPTREGSTNSVEADLAGKPLKAPGDVAKEMLDESRQVLVFEEGDEPAAREVMKDLVHQLADEMLVSDPSLENLVVIENESSDLSWTRDIPVLTVTTIEEISLGRFVLDRSQCIVSLSREFLRRRASGAVTKATRFYTLVSKKSLQRVTKVHPVHKAIFLKDSA
jgi:hypothetical protein